MRETLEPGSTDLQMATAWGHGITNTAKTNKICWEANEEGNSAQKVREEGKLKNYCYLCGGPILGNKVNTSGGKNRYPAEMEHKLPCGDFYSKFQFIKSEFPGEYIQWQQFISNLPQYKLWEIYLRINDPRIYQDKEKPKNVGYIRSALILQSENIVNNFINII